MSPKAPAAAPPAESSAPDPITIALTLREALRPLRFGPPVTHVYQPLDYAFAAHRRWLERYGTGPREALLLGMNPGPWGMAQTGVPFGEPASVRDILGLEVPVDPPADEHPKRPVRGFASTRREVSGQRLWRWIRDVFGGPDAFFARFAIVNYCPLSFMEASGRNRTPDKLPAAERAPLFDACDAALRARVAHHRPRWIVGIGAFAEQRARAVLGDVPGLRIGRVLHPSPASPRANRGWAAQATAELADLGLADAGHVSRAQALEASGGS